MKNSFLRQIYSRYQKNVNVFHKSYIFSFIHQKRFYKNQEFYFFGNIYDTKKNVEK